MEKFSRKVDSHIKVDFNCGIEGRKVWVMTIHDLIKSKQNVVLCLECASGYHGISTFSYEDNLMILVETDDRESMYKCFGRDNISYYGIDKIDYNHCIPISETVYVTDIPLTICQMIQFDCHEFHMFEAIDDLYTYHSDLVKETEELARSFGILDKLLKYKELAEQAYEEDNE